MKTLSFEIEYDWVPYRVRGVQQYFNELKNAPSIRETDRSHIGCVVYKWYGLIDKGPHHGKHGVLIGETDDLSQRIRQYCTGTQKCGNKHWREDFLENGEIYLWILSFKNCLINGLKYNDLTSKNLRLIIEQMLVRDQIQQDVQNIWIVNSKQ